MNRKFTRGFRGFLFVGLSVCLFVFCFDFLFLKANNKTRNKQGKESEKKNLEIKAYKF